MKRTVALLAFSAGALLQAAEPSLYRHSGTSLRMVPLANLDGQEATVSVPRYLIDACSNDASVFFTAGRFVYQLPFGSSQAVSILDFGEVNAIAVRDDVLYIAQRKRIFRTPLDNIQPELIIENPDGYISDLACDGTNLYWSDEDFGIYRAPAEGGDRTVVAPTNGAAMAMTFSGNTLYWIEDGQPERLGKMNKDGSGAVTLLDLRSTFGSVNYIPSSLSIADGRIWWGDSGVETTFSCRLDGTAPSEVTPQGSPSSHAWVFPNSESEAAFGEIIISQEHIDYAADFGTGFGQTFTLAPGQTVSAIQLHLDSVPFGGGSIRMRLWQADGEPGIDSVRSSSSPLSEGTLLKATIADTTGWHTVILDSPYTNQEGTPQYLVFEIELLTSGSDGYNEYSVSGQDSYRDGDLVSWDGNQYHVWNGEDLAFRVLSSTTATDWIQVPTPQIFTEVVYGNPGVQFRATLVIENSRSDLDYTLLATEDLSLPLDQWETIGTQPGYGGVVDWGIAYGIRKPSHFFIVQVRPKEP